MFTLDPTLAADTHVVGRYPLCLCLLMNNARYPWLILVPQRAGLREVHELSEPDQQQLLRESSWTSARLAEGFAADKMNVANLGNVVAQLHWHVIARHHGDDDWPAPVWGRQPALPYAADALAERLRQLRDWLGRADGPGLAC